MPDEDDLRRLLRDTDAPNTLDSNRIVSRSRARRLPRQLAAGTVGALALAGVTVLAVQTTQFTAPATTTAGQAYDESAPSQDSMAPETSAIKRAPADRINLCEAELAQVSGSQYGLQLEVVAPTTVPAGAGIVDATVRLTNTSSQTVTGTTDGHPVIVLSQNGLVLWHRSGPIDQPGPLAVDLAPGESLDLGGYFEPVRCSSADDLGAGLPTGLPAVEPGEYQLSALLDFTPDPSMGPLTSELDLVAGPLTTLTVER